jgi:hypothetical protein
MLLKSMNPVFKLFTVYFLINNKFGTAIVTLGIRVSGLVLLLYFCFTNHPKSTQALKII